MLSKLFLLIRNVIEDLIICNCYRSLKLERIEELYAIHYFLNYFRLSMEIPQKFKNSKIFLLVFLLFKFAYTPYFTLQNLNFEPGTHNTDRLSSISSSLSYSYSYENHRINNKIINLGIHHSRVSSSG